MKKITAKIILILIAAALLIIPFSITNATNTNDGRDIMEAVRDKDAPSSIVSNSRMTIQKGAGDPEIKLFEVFSLEIDDDTTYTLMDFSYPSRIKFLSYSREEDDDDQWILMSNQNSPRRINSSDRTGAFLGSHVSYEDMAIENLDNYNFTKLADAAIPFGNFRGTDCYKVQAVKTSGSDTNYGNVIFYVRKTDYMVLRTEFYDQSGNPLKVMNIQDITEDQGYDIVRSTKVQLAGSQNQYTVIEVLDYDLDTLNVDDDAYRFRVENLTR